MNSQRNQVFFYQRKTRFRKSMKASSMLSFTSNLQSVGSGTLISKVVPHSILLRVWGSNCQNWV